MIKKNLFLYLTKVLEKLLLDYYSGEDFYENYNRLEFGIYLGAGIFKEFGIGSFILDARFGINLSDAKDTDTLYPNGKPDGYEVNRFNDLVVSVGYLFPLGG